MPEPAHTPGRRPLVLVVDDHPDIRLICAKALEQAGYRTATAGSGDEALAALAAGAPDLIVLDLMMPGIDGLHAERLRAHAVRGLLAGVLREARRGEAA